VPPPDATESALNRNSGPVANGGSPSIYATTLCVNDK
jgi:hypothetical protein